MNKMNLAGTSLVAAIPAGFLGYLMVMAVMNNMDTMPTVMKVVAILLLLVSVTVVLFPVYVMIYHGGGKKVKDSQPAQPKAETAAIPTAGGDEIEGEFDDESSDDLQGFADDESLDDEFDDDEFEADDEFEFDDDEEEF